MKPICVTFLPILILATIFTRSVVAQTEDIIYGRKDGMALTMVVQKPDTIPNGKGIICVVSMGWTSDYNWIFLFRSLMKPLSEKGYTLFYVMHGSQPKYTVPETIDDIKKAVHFIRYHASEYGIDPDHIGITGGSAGGHLSLVMGTTGDEGNPSAADPVERVSSRVQAVACFFPPVDFLNYSHEGDNVVLHSEIEAFQAPFDFMEWNAETLHFYPVTDPEAQTEIGRQISPYYFITPDDAPVYVVHGDADKTVPLSQSERLIEKLQEAGIPCELIIKPGADHGIWPDMDDYAEGFVDWFDLYLKD
jgi:acetyl esterase/lipase